MTIAELIITYGVSIDTPRIPANFRPVNPTPYTLKHQGRELAGAIQANETLTCEQALTSAFVMADAGQELAELNRAARSTERELKRLLGRQYEEFHQAYLADKRYQRRG